MPNSPEYMRAYYLSRKVYELARGRARVKKRKQEMVNYAGGSCIKCGYNASIFALQFHHREPKDRSFGLSGNSVRSKAWESITAEIDKCDLLCANCHAETHWGY